MFDHDLVHLCVEDVSICLNILTLEASVNVERLTFYLGASWYCVGCLSCAICWPCNDVHYFCSRHLWRRRTLLCEYCIQACSVTSEHNPAFVQLTLRFQLRIFEMTDVHRRSKMDCSFALLCFQDDLLFALYLGHLPVQNFSSFSHSLSTAAFASRIFIAWGQGMNLYKNVSNDSTSWTPSPRCDIRGLLIESCHPSLRLLGETRPNFFEEKFSSCGLITNKGGFSDLLISSRQSHCSICEWEHEVFIIFRRVNFLRIESPCMDFLTRPKFSSSSSSAKKNLLSKFHPHTVRIRWIFQVKLSDHIS